MKTSLEDKGEGHFQSAFGRMDVCWGDMCTLLQRACQGIIVLSMSLGAAAGGVVRSASGGSVCVCVCGGGGRGWPPEGFCEGFAGGWGACAGAYFLMGLRACGFVALCNNSIGFRHRNPTSTYQFITNNHVSFHLWWKKDLPNHQKVSKYYEHDNRYDCF